MMQDFTEARPVSDNTLDFEFCVKKSMNTFFEINACNIVYCDWSGLFEALKFPHRMQKVLLIIDDL